MFAIKARRRCLAVASCALLLCGVAGAQSVPRSFVASPDVYKVVAENAQYMVIEVTWKPGQRDVVHAHAPASGVYYLTDCSLRFFMDDGARTVDANPKAGFSVVQGVVPMHSVQNIGSKDCKLVMFEPK